MSYRNVPQTSLPRIRTTLADWGVAYKVALGVVAAGVFLIVLSPMVGGILHTQAITPLIELLGAPGDRQFLPSGEPRTSIELLAVLGSCNIVVGISMFCVRLVLELLGLAGAPTATRRMKAAGKACAGHGGGRVGRVRRWRISPYSCLPALRRPRVRSPGDNVGAGRSREDRCSTLGVLPYHTLAPGAWDPRHIVRLGRPCGVGQAGLWLDQLALVGVCRRWDNWLVPLPWCRGQRLRRYRRYRPGHGDRSASPGRWRAIVRPTILAPR